MTNLLFTPTQVGSLSIKNRIVMAPLTRSRAVDNNTPNSLMATYYAQRAEAGLIITEGTSPSPNGLGYARIPGLFNDSHVQGWKLVTDAVHAKGGKILVQLMHTGRVSSLINLPSGAEVLSPSLETCPGEMWTDAQGNQPHSPPRAMNAEDIKNVTREYANAASLAIKAGFDGVELHAANGYLLEQFLNANVNHRTDEYGGTSEGRNRIVLEVVRATVEAIGADRVGIRLSPHGVFNSTGAFSGVDEQYVSLAKALSTLGIMYVHVLDHSALGAPAVPAKLKADMRAAFGGKFIQAGGFDGASAAQALTEHPEDLIAFGRSFIANPDLVNRLHQNAPLNVPNPDTFYTPTAEGYTDYPSLNK